MTQSAQKKSPKESSPKSGTTPAPEMLNSATSTASPSALGSTVNKIKHDRVFKRYRWIIMMFAVLAVVSISSLIHFAPPNSFAVVFPQWNGIMQIVPWCGELLNNIVSHSNGQLVRNIITAIFLIAIYCYALDNTKLILVNEPKKYSIATILSGVEILCIALIININRELFFPKDFAFFCDNAQLWQWLGQQTLFAICLALPTALIANLVNKNFAFATAIFEAMMIMVQVNMPGENYKFFYYTLIVATISIPCFKNITCRNDYFRGGIGLSLCMLIILPLLYLENFNDVPKRYFLLIALITGLITGLGCFNAQWFFEFIFDLNTPLRLAEIHNNNELLHRLQIEAPGTASHVANVAAMAKQAALRINANPDLVTVMAVYHDIGKLKAPQYFSENQTNGNPHEHLSPKESAQIIIDHVSYGLAIAKEYKLAKPLCDAIRTHHGNSLVLHFYNVACKQAQEKGEPLPNKRDFQYPYDRPTTKEEIIVSLADACEAAVRALENNTRHDQAVRDLTLKTTDAMHAANPAVTKEEIDAACDEAIRKLNAEQPQKRIDCINSIFLERIKESQLDMAQITMKELSEIKKSFIDYYQYDNHSRTQYMKL